MPVRRVGWFGGSFDPAHLAHRALADAALQQLQLDELRWVVAGQPWQKAGRQLAEARHRAAMVALMIEDDARQRLDERELRRDGPSYTLDSIREVQQEQPGDELWLVLGQDQLARLPSWHGWKELVARTGLAVAARAGAVVTPPDELLACPHRLTVLAMPAMEQSSTEVRRRAAAGEDLTPMVGGKVAGYIARHRLYQEPANAGLCPPRPPEGEPASRGGPSISGEN